jgi:hypothetical protein
MDENNILHDPSCTIGFLGQCVVMLKVLIGEAHVSFNIGCHMAILDPSKCMVIWGNSNVWL